MKKLITICLVAGLILAASSTAVGMITVDFEGIPDLYVETGAINLGNYLPGLTFGPDATILDKVRTAGYNYTSYPPHSGDAVLFSYTNSTIRVDFDIPSTYVETWYTSAGNFYLEAYDAGDTLLDSATGASNIGSNSLISVSGANIAYVLFHDVGNFYTIDDLGFTPIPAPGAILLGGIGVALVGWLRRRRTL